LILDEATSSLDTQTEKALLAAANEAFQGRTVITIAVSLQCSAKIRFIFIFFFFLQHRLSTILNYDRVIILENGKIVEDGNPRQLQENKSSKFHEMVMASSNNNHSNTATRD
jgi:ABC-type multidrug transport system fused ATPase/permease subunit